MNKYCVAAGANADIRFFEGCGQNFQIILFRGSGRLKILIC